MGSRRETSIYKIIGRFKSDGLIENKSGRGRKSILSDAAKLKALKDIKIDPKVSTVKLAAETSRIMGRSVSAETVRNVIRHVGYHQKIGRIGTKTFSGHYKSQRNCNQILTLSLYVVARVAEWYRYRTVACLVTSSSPAPPKTRRVGQRCTLNRSRAEMSSRWCGVVVRRGGASSGVVHVI
ncbi:transposable element Tcb2 transposase [Trichonephila clavipes]|nr:transposable element Tcb2 transposase [Trichonephila clavipes]